jgi:hypothetical protein
MARGALFRFWQQIWQHRAVNSAHGLEPGHRVSRRRVHHQALICGITDSGPLCEPKGAPTNAPSKAPRRRSVYVVRTGPGARISQGLGLTQRVPITWRRSRKQQRPACGSSLRTCAGSAEHEL